MKKYILGIFTAFICMGIFSVNASDMPVPENLYLEGNLAYSQGVIHPQSSLAFTPSDTEAGVFTLSNVEFISNYAGNSQFNFINIQSWDGLEDGTHMYGPGPEMGTTVIPSLTQPNPFMLIIESMWQVEPGTYDIKVDFNTGEFYIWLSDSGAVKNIDKETEKEIIYNLQGAIVDNPQKGEIYIIKGKKIVWK